LVSASTDENNGRDHMTTASIRRSGKRAAAPAAPPTGGVPAPLDPTFGTGGLARPPVFGRAVSLLSQPDGRLLLLTTRISSFVVTRLDRDGRLDPSFGDAGVATVGLADQAVLGRGLALQPDGRILLVGTAKQPGPVRLAVVRLTAGGRLDQSFSGDGRLTLTFGAAATVDAAAAVVQSDGRVIVVGSARTDLSSNSVGRLVAARLQPDGGLDLGYGVLGKVDLPVPGFLGIPTAAALDTAGNLLVAGHTFMSDTASDMFVMRLRADGTADPAFGTNGLVITDFGTGNETTGGLVVQPDGRLVLAGSAQQSLHSTRPALLRLLPDGRLDPAFGNAGRVLVELGLPAGIQVASDVALMPDGRLAIAGRAADQFGDQGRAFVAVLTPGGALDGSFGDIVVPDLGAPVEVGSALAVQPDGGQVAAHTLGSPEQPVLIRVGRASDTADLSLTLTPDRATAGPGTLTLTALVGNSGPVAAQGVRLTVTASKAISVPESTQGKVVLEPSRIRAVVLIGTIAVGAQVTVTFQTSVTGFEGTITAAGVIAAATPDPSPSDHQRTVEVLTTRLETE